LPITRKQFLVSLFILIASFVAFSSFENQFIKVIFFILIFFSVITSWGAFDEVYYNLKKLDDDKSRQISDDASKKTTNDIQFK